MKLRIGSTWLLTAGLLFVAAPAQAAPPQQASAPTGKVVVVHGLRGIVADVWLDGAAVLTSFAPERATDPIDVPVGSHHVDIRAAGAPETARPLLSGDIEVTADADLTVVAHLDAAGTPVVSVYEESAGSVPAGRSRVVVRHTAAAPAIGVTIDDQPLVADVQPGNEASRDVAPGTHAVAVTSGAADATPLLAPEDLPLEEGSGMVLYLIGSRSDDTLTWLAQRVRGRATLPSRIATGDSGLRTVGASGNSSGVSLAGGLLALTIALTLGGLFTIGVRGRKAAR